MAGIAPLEVKDLCKRYQKGLHSFAAVDGLSFTMDEGEILGFLGPNGAGKTTTIKCVLGLLSPTSGGIALWGASPASGDVRKRLGYVPENPDYEDVFSPMEFLRLISGMRGMAQSRSEMVNLLGRVGLSGWETTRLRRFSKGMRQKFSLALALQFKPDLMVMDEPTGGLDPAARKDFRDIILEENRRGAAIFLSSHLLSEVEVVCDRAIILSRGRVVREGSMDELRRTENEYRILYRARPTSEKPETTAEKVVSVQNLQETIDSLRREGCEIIELGEVFRSLEDVFLTATLGGSS